jgi:hypothetical protein
LRHFAERLTHACDSIPTESDCGRRHFGHVKELRIPMRKTIIAAALCATLLATGGAIAAQQMPQPRDQDAPRPPMRDGMLHADADKDGVVTRAELLADVDARFGKVDANHDGKITPEERTAVFEAMRAKMAERRHDGPGPGGPGGRAMRADANGDGIVTIEEQRAQAEKMFDYVDRNHDGRVDQAERDQAREMMMSMRGPGGHGGHHRGPPPPPPAEAPDGPSGQQ